MKLKKHIFRWFGGAALAMALVTGATGCTDDFGQNFGQEDLGEKVHGVLSIQMGPSTPVQASRAVDFSPSAMVKIDSYWVGVFDTKTGELIGTKYDVHPRKDDGTRWTLRNDNDTPFTVDGIDIFYYEHNPNAYIVGVVNFNDVKAKKPGDTEATTDVIDYLTEVKQLKDLKDIVIDTQSADKANRDRGSDWANPLMMGFYSTAKTSVHTQMNPDGTIYDSPVGIIYGNYETSQEAVAHISGSNGVDINLSEGSIRLQRLLAEVNVRILPYEFDYSSSRNTNNIKNVRYKVMNKPLDVYLVEHAVDLGAWDRTSKDDFLANTANSADFTDNFISDNGWNYAYDYYDDYYGRWIYTFSYQHYENKRYGKDWWNYTNDDFYDYFGNGDHFYREKRYPDEAASNGLSDIYRTLCPSVDQPWNNHGTYIVVEVEFENEYWNRKTIYDPNEGKSDVWYDTETHDAKVYYIIHEGYTYKVDGFDMEGMIMDSRLDFQTQRNTQYLYDLRIGGADGLRWNVTFKDYDEENYHNFHNDGIYGEASYVLKMEIDNTNKPTFREIDELTLLHRKDLKWIGYQYLPSMSGSGGTTFYFGNWTSADGTLYYDDSEGKINVNSIWDPTKPSSTPPPVSPDLYPIYYPLAYEFAYDAVYVTKGNSIEEIEEGYNNYIDWMNEWYEKWEEEHPGQTPGPNDYPDEYDLPFEYLKYCPLYYFLELEDDHPFLQLNRGEYFYYCFAPYLVTDMNGDDDNINYDRLEQYKRQFLIIDPKRGDDDDCTILGDTKQFVQYAYDDRTTLRRNTLYNHDYDWSGKHNSSYYDSDGYSVYSCGAPGIVTWIMVDQYFNNDDPYKLNPGYEVKVGNKTYSFSSDEIIEVYRWNDTDRLLGIPLVIDYNSDLGNNSKQGTNYGMFDMTITAKPNPKYYRPESSTTYYNGLYIQRQNTGARTGGWQWVFSDVTPSTYGWSRIWEFYNNSNNMFNVDFEYGGLTIVNNKGTDPSSRKAISTAKYPLLDRVNDDDVTQVDCLTFGGGYGNKAPGSRSDDAMMLKFWIDRPGDIYLSYGYNGNSTNREWRAYWRDETGNKKSTQYLYWPNNTDENNHVIPERKGIISSGDINNFWPDINPDNGKFLDGPIEICIYMASSAGYIRSIEFDPWVWDTTPKFPDNGFIMPVPDIP